MLILNPHAGEGRQTEFARRAAAERPWLDLRETTRAEDCPRLVQQAVEQRYDTIIVGGGDGTVHDVVNALAEHFDLTPGAGVRLAIMPLGTANDLSKTLGLPREPAAALDLIERGPVRRIDLLRAESARGVRHLINAASGGFSEQVNARLDDEQKERWGALAYLRVGLDALPEATMHRTRLVIDGEAFEMQSCAVVVANGRYTGGMHVAPEAEIDDHRMDVGVVMAETIGERAKLLAKAFVGTHMADEHIFYRRARKLEIHCDPPMRFNGDGEALGETPITFKLLPGTLEMIAEERHEGT